MSRLTKHLTAAILTFLFAGCIPSVHPLYTDDVLVFDPALIGTWTVPDNGEIWTFVESDDNAYQLIYTDEDGMEATFEARLVSLDGRRFLDLYPEPGDSRYPNLYEAHFIPGHTFMRVRETSPTLRMAPVNPTWLDSVLTSNPEALAHEREDGMPILTAPSTALQKFILKHHDTEDAWGEETEMRKGG